jgi:hypothetical protein
MKIDLFTNSPFMMQMFVGYPDFKNEILNVPYDPLC